MRKYLYQIIVLISIAIGVSISAKAEITLPTTSYSLEVGIDKYLSVPNATYGYIDHAIWACNNSNIAFKEKDEAGAIIYIANSFTGQAVIELLATEKYLDYKGHTRALTYYKQYIISCIGGGGEGGGKVSEIALPEDINLNLGETKRFNILKGDCYNGAFNLTWKQSNPNNFAVYSVNYNTGVIEISGAMTGEGVLNVSTVAGDERDCKIVVKAPEVPSDRRTEKLAISDIKSLIVSVLSLADYSEIEEITYDGGREQAIDFLKPMDIYNLSGQKIYLNFNQLSEGIYILRQGNVSRKVIVTK